VAVILNGNLAEGDEGLASRVMLYKAGADTTIDEVAEVTPDNDAVKV
jgi:hypothetical protein